MKGTYKNHGVSLILNHDDRDTPAMVSVTKGGKEYTSTYDCASGTGFVGSNDEVELTEDQVNWLNSPANEDRVTKTFEKARFGHPDYN